MYHHYRGQNSVYPAETSDNVDLRSPGFRPSQPLEGKALAQSQWLRETRRNRGLTQIDLSEMLGVSQSRISAWENGYDEIPYRQRLRLIDILSNRHGRLDPFVKHMIRTEPYLAIHGAPHYRYLHVAPKLVPQFFHPDDQFFNWSPTDHRQSGLREYEFFSIARNQGREISDSILQLETERDIPRVRKSPLRMRCHQVALTFEDNRRLIVSRYEMVGKARGQAPQLFQQVHLEDMDYL